ncbi:hypothetical protein A5745_19560 [Mycobacterium sp. IS-2888]|uniref:DUF732 domain-containing protein n=1 Tax=Mycobacterium sp. IS-2888 TaxID=1834159 RepID=UPI00096EE98A|nr:DUF732 domain-containing protein [Mycobacterium sp. IS-2888]OMC54475.1 hypothetical protein A5745_19560 [Mycobacterium sp. IS-2888]
MRTGIIRLAAALVGVSVLLAGASVCAGGAGADTQQDQFLARLQQLQIPALDGVPGLVYHAHEICGQLDSGTPGEDVVTNVMNKAYDDNPSLRAMSARARRTAVRFVTASVDVYCPSHQGEIPPA